MTKDVTPKKIVKKKKNVIKLVPYKAAHGEQAFMEDVRDIVSNVKELGDIRGYVVLAVYKDGVGCRFSVPEFVPDHLLPSYTAEVLRDFMRDSTDHNDI